ncbi:carboxylesterase 5A [Cephus cinctus]|uniref:Carboxylic ester hydrolase n=1 Tax=Cephus cinctus TaxID=211228 RepID=A0AAJ7C1G5_CEPCN|nr:carboxylesterase 5A [Cephus cinctus]
MKYSVWFLSALLQQFLFLGILTPVYTQRTHARQGINREAPIVQIPEQGTLIGKEIFLTRTQRVLQYLGIPYAQPPIGPGRFSAPITNPLPSWRGNRTATQFGPSCQQVSGNKKLHEIHYIQLLPPDQPDPGFSEDCLFLNIFVPDGNRPPDGWPVMVWFHGGDFNTGTPAIWDASIFVTKQKTLVVTVAYRLNILGFFTTTDAAAPGNYGMLDQIAALDWIRKNIEIFGGSSSNIVIYGHSSGAISVGLHMLSPLSRGKFSKAIALSGDAIGSVRTPEAEEPVVDLVADKFGCIRRPTYKLMECLRRTGAELLVQVSSDIETWGPIVDAETTNSSDPFLPEHPKDILDSGNFNAVPLLTGFTNNEQALVYSQAIGGDGGINLMKFESLIEEEITAAIQMPDENSTCEVKPHLAVDAVLFFYRPHPPNQNPAVLRDKYLDFQTEKNYASGLTLMAGKLSRKEQAFVYRFDYRPRTVSVTKNVSEWAGVPHMFELQFIWGLPYTVGSTTQWNAADKKMADVMMTMMTNFAKSGNPSQPNIKWEPFTENNPGILIINRNINMSDSSSVDYKALAFWNEYYPMVLDEAMNNCCNMTAGSMSFDHYSYKNIYLLTSIFVTILTSAPL